MKTNTNEDNKDNDNNDREEHSKLGNIPSLDLKTDRAVLRKRLIAEDDKEIVIRQSRTVGGANKQGLGHNVGKEHTIFINS